jgi:hypothetical protein
MHLMALRYHMHRLYPLERSQPHFRVELCTE